jgi:antitoxin VapB
MNAYARHMAPKEPAHGNRASLFRIGANQAVRIPLELELPGKEVIIRAEEGRLIIESVRGGRGLLELLASWKPITDTFPVVDEGLNSNDEPAPWSATGWTPTSSPT